MSSLYNLFVNQTKSKSLNQHSGYELAFDVTQKIFGDVTYGIKAHGQTLGLKWLHARKKKVRKEYDY